MSENRKRIKKTKKNKFFEEKTSNQIIGNLPFKLTKAPIDVLAEIIIPDVNRIPGAKKISPAYIIFENYEKILNWNRSLRFALAVCTLKENFKNEI